MTNQARVAVIGAGLAGLSCASLLNAAGLATVIFEKSRGAGGRIATRRMDGYQFDHGAQYLTARSPEFAACLAQASASGMAAAWPVKGAQTEDPQTEWIVGRPGMSGVVGELKAGLHIVSERRITAIDKQGRKVAVSSEDGGTHGPFDAVAVTAPAPQSHALLAPVDPVFDALSNTVMAPCWAGLFAFETRVDPGFDYGKKLNAAIGWVARDSSKPGRRSEPDCWVVHASPEWSRDKLEIDKETAAALLLAEFHGLSGQDQLPPAISASAHRWRYALAEKPLRMPFLSSRDNRLVAAGDWCLAGRAEAAFQSGQAAAKHLIDHLNV